MAPIEPAATPKSATGFPDPGVEKLIRRVGLNLTLDRLMREGVVADSADIVAV